MKYKKLKGKQPPTLTVDADFHTSGSKKMSNFMDVVPTQRPKKTIAGTAPALKSRRK